jgi:hypothetical protein
MKTRHPSIAVGVFEDRLHANRAITELRQAGFGHRQIGVAMQHPEAREDIPSTEHDSHAGSGAVTGLGFGALAGLGVLVAVFPVGGPTIIAVGTLGIILSTAAAGAGMAGLVAALIGAGLPGHEARYYQGELEAGHSIITVNAPGRVDEVTFILRHCGGYDMSSQRAPAVSTLRLYAGRADIDPMY